VVTLLGCIAPDAWWANRRARIRVVVIVLVMGCFGLLVSQPDVTFNEAVVELLVGGAAVGIVVDVLIGGVRMPLRRLGGLVHQLTAQAAPPAALRRWQV
jgi:hypothetical protein